MASKKTAVAKATQDDLVIMYPNDSLAQCCGVGEVGGFALVRRAPRPTYPGDDAPSGKLREYHAELRRWLGDEEDEYDQEIEEHGTGYFVATFNEEEVSKVAFTTLQDLGHQLVYESDPRQNGNGNFVSIGIFLHKNAVARDAAAKKAK